MFDILNEMDRKCNEATCRLDDIGAEIEALDGLELGPEPDDDDHPVPSGDISHEAPEDHTDVASFGDDFDMNIKL
ncbi:MAG: hypothetical protein ABEI98_08570 [Halorhabdus sp.]